MARSETFESLLTSAGAKFGEWLAAPVVTSFGDANAEAAALSDGALCLADRSARGTVVAVGEDVVPLLQGIVTSDVFKLVEPGSGQFSTAVNSKGRMVCDLRIMHGPEILVMDFEPGLVEDGIISHFRANVMMEDAKFLDRSPQTSVVGVFGDEAGALLDELGDFVRPAAPLQEYHGTWGRIAGADAVVRRMPLGWDIMVDVEFANDLWDLFLAQGATPVGEDALEVMRVAAGIPRWGAELDAKVIPLEAHLGDTIAFDKGCYVGQEIIARLDTLGTPAKLLRMLEVTGAVSTADTIFDGDKKVGEVRSVARPPGAEHLLALAYVKRDHNAPGHELQIGDDRVVATIR